MDMLNSLLPGKDIRSIRYLSTENVPLRDSDKKTIFDIYCIRENGERFIVEMQIATQANFMDRAFYYSTYPIREQLDKKLFSHDLDSPLNHNHDKTYKLSPVYVVCILNFNIRTEDEGDLRDGLVSEYKVGNKLSHKPMSDK